jgi:acyl carrier protein
MPDEIETQLRQYLVANLLFSDEGFPYDDDTSFLQEGLIDSLGVMELVTYVGSAFGIEVRAEDVTAENFDSVRRLASYIRKKTAGIAEAPLVLESNARAPGNVF